MIEATSCGGVVIFRGKILLLYKNFKNKYEGWVLPKGTVEEGEEYKETAIREVLEESGAKAKIINYNEVKKMKYLVVIPDGMADERVAALGNRTPMEAAVKPCMDELCRRAEVGTVLNVQAYADS